MKPPQSPSLKEAQQEEHLRLLREAPPSEKAKIILNNSGFDAAIYRNRKSVIVKFGSSAK